jgi:hypothetical protein
MLRVNEAWVLVWRPSGKPFVPPYDAGSRLEVFTNKETAECAAEMHQYLCGEEGDDAEFVVAERLEIDEHGRPAA